MTATRITFTVFLHLIICSTVFSQLRQPVFNFQKDDTVLRRTYYEQALQNKNKLIGSLGPTYKKDYKEIYESRFETVAELLQSSRPVTEKEANNYLQSILKRIIDVNPELQGKEIRLLFSRDWWPNAYSVGEGTLVVNAGLMIYLTNEAELAFVLCHELAHLFLDHSNNAIKKHVETVNSEAFKKEIKRLQKEEYRVNQQLEALLKPILMSSRSHRRENEAEADRYAFIFMKKTGYDCNAINSCLAMLGHVDDTSSFNALDVQQAFNFAEYPFKKRWIQKESVLFGELKEDNSPLTKREKDSMQTHPDCDKRIQLLKDSIGRFAGPGQYFLISEGIFNQLKKDFYVEIAEQEYKNKNLSRNLYYSLLMLQREEYTPFALFSIARALNTMYEGQKDHRLGAMTEGETRGYKQDYNLLLRMISRLKLDEIALLSYQFCKQYREQMSGYIGFEEEYNKAKKRIQP
jgi:peptidase M48-like protein